jgi:hypothetical protein
MRKGRGSEKRVTVSEMECSEEYMCVKWLREASWMRLVEEVRFEVCTVRVRREEDAASGAGE